MQTVYFCSDDPDRVSLINTRYSIRVIKFMP